MLITVKTWNGHTLNDSDYETALLNPNGLPDAQPVYLAQANADSLDAGTYTVNTQNKVLTIKIKDYTNRYDLLAQLKTWFKRGTQGDLVVTFLDDDVDYQMSCRAVNFVQDDAWRFTAILQTGQTAWRAVSETNRPGDPWDLTVNASISFDVAGRDETFLSLDITPIDAPADTWLYQQIYRLVNVPGVDQGTIPWCITVDTAALVTATKMRSDCADLRIINLNTGQELKRWISGANTTTTKVWIVLTLGPGYSLTLASGVAGSGAITELSFGTDANTLASIEAMPYAGIVYHGNEWFAYYGKDSVAGKLFVTQRGLFGTTEESHLAGTTFSYIQYPLAMKYGYPMAAAPDASDSSYDNTKPMIKLSSSSNTSWVWDATTGFFDYQRRSRPAQWILGMSSQYPSSKIYSVKQDAASGDPCIGFEVASHLLGMGYQDETVQFEANFARNAGITSISITGESYRSSASWLQTAALQYSTDTIVNGQIPFVTVWSESSPGSLATWTTWSHAGATFGGTIRYLRVIFAGGFSSNRVSCFADFEILTATANFPSLNIPASAFLSESSICPLALTITNTVTGDSIKIDTDVLLTKTFSIDGETRLTTYDGAPAYGAITLDDPSRSAYIRLEGNATNTIEISCDSGDVGELHIYFHWYTRRL